MDDKYKTEEIISRLVENIDKCLFDSKVFLNFIITNNIFLSGGFLLQAISDKEYDNYDIDLFVMGKKDDTLLQNFKSLWEQYNEQIKLWSNSDPSLSVSYPLAFDVVYCTSNFLNKKINSIQFIFINDYENTNPEDYVKKFDIDICANYYDGEKLFIKNLNGIITNDATILYSQLNKDITRLIVERTENRISKYYERGFNINFVLEEVYRIYRPDTPIWTNDEYHNKVLTESKNILLIYDKPNDKNQPQNFNYNKLSNQVEKLIIYSYKYDDELSNLPINLKQLTIYNSIHFLPNMQVNHDIFNDKIIAKLPFGCELKINQLPKSEDIVLEKD
jgi:hypothetical protein